MQKHRVSLLFLSSSLACYHDYSEKISESLRVDGEAKEQIISLNFSSLMPMVEQVQELKNTAFRWFANGKYEEAAQVMNLVVFSKG